MKTLLPALALTALTSCSGTTQPSSDPHTMNPNPDSSVQALLVVDLQNDFCSTDGKMHGLVADELESTDVLAKSLRLVHAARERGIPTFVTPLQFDYTSPPAGLPEGIAAPILENRAFDRNGTGGQLVPELRSLVDGRNVIELPKPSLSAFAGTDLDAQLRARGVEEIVLAGLVTNFCVESTARDAFDLGYRVRVVGDATAGFDATHRNFALETVFPMLGRVIRTDEFTGAAAAR